MSNNIDILRKLIKRDREGNFLHIKRKIYQNEVTIINFYALKTRAHTFIKYYESLNHALPSTH